MSKNVRVKLLCDDRAEAPSHTKKHRCSDSTTLLDTGQIIDQVSHYWLPFQILVPDSTLPTDPCGKQESTWIDAFLICSVIFFDDCTTLITPFLFFCKKYGPDLDFKPEAQLTLTFGNKKSPHGAQMTVSPKRSRLHIKRYHSDLDHAQIPSHLVLHLEIFSLELLHGGPKPQQVARTSAFSKIGHIDLQESPLPHTAGQTFEIFWHVNKRRFPTVLGFQDFLQHARKMVYLLGGDTTSRDH